MHRILKEATYTKHTSCSKLYSMHCCVLGVPEYAIRCGEIEVTTICDFNVSYIHLDGCDTHSNTIVLEEK